MSNDLFHNLFVLELARNHWGSVERGKKIIRAYAEVAKANNIKACIKLQAFDTDSFIHKDFLPKGDELKDGENTQAPGSHTRYIKKTLATRLSPEEFKELIDEIKKEGLYTMVTPYDETSVDLCGELDVDIMKLASSDTGCLSLVEKVIKLGKPLAISTGAVTLEHIDRVVRMAEENNIPLAINHCVSNYPSEDSDLELNQIDFWRNRYPNHIIGFSSHDYHNINTSHVIARRKGARTFERHIDINLGDYPVSLYCILPETADNWFKAHNTQDFKIDPKKEKEMLGTSENSVRSMTEIEKGYLKSVNRGAYALRDLPEGYKFTYKRLGIDYYLAIPLQEGQISSRELDGIMVVEDATDKDAPLMKDRISQY
jgi:sialic acid synthase SpsE